METFTRELNDHSVLWFFISIICGGFLGAFIKYLFEILLPERRTEKKTIKAIKRKYSLPILRAADQLRTRLWNIINNIDLITEDKWLDNYPKDKDDYYFVSTLYLFAQFMFWVETLNRKITYLDLSSDKETIKFNQYLGLILSGFFDISYFSDFDKSKYKDESVYIHNLHAIGQKMIVIDGSGNEECLCYSSFYDKYHNTEEKEFQFWISKMEKLIKNVSNNKTDLRWERLIIIYHFINLFIEYVDHRHIRTDKRPILFDRVNHYKIVNTVSTQLKQMNIESRTLHQRNGR